MGPLPARGQEDPLPTDMWSTLPQELKGKKWESDVLEGRVAAH